MRRLLPGLTIVALLGAAGIRTGLRDDTPSALAGASFIRGGRLARRFELARSPDAALLTVAALPAGSVRCNGREVFRGGLAQDGGAPRRVDVARVLLGGDNEIALELPAGGRIALVLEIAERGGGSRRLVSDRTFREPGAGTIASLAPRPRRCRPPIDAPPSSSLPRALRFASPTRSGLFDLGLERVGDPVVIGVPAATRILYGESAGEALSATAYESERAADLDHVGRGFLRRAFRFVRLDPPSPAAKVGIVPVPEPVAPRGAFACSDTELTRAYQLSAWTIRQCTRDLLEDGVKRDRMAWSGDLVVSLPAALYLYGPHPAVPATLAALARRRAASGALPPVAPLQVSWHLDDYVSASILAVDAAHRLAGDAATRELLPVVAEQEAWLARAMASGAIVTAKEGPITDWMSHERRTGSVTYQQGMAILARVRAAELLGDPARAAAAEEARRRIAARLASVRDPASGLLPDRLDDPGGAISHDGNVLAILAGLDDAPAATLDAIARRLWSEHGPRAYLAPAAATGAPLEGRVIAPFMAGLEALARFEHDDAPGACELIRRTWRPMVASGAAYELMDLDGLPARHPGRNPHWTSLCHAWSSAPAWLMPAYVLGVRPEAPGFEQYLVAPRNCGLAWAKGRVPMGSDVLDVSWERRGEGFEVRLRAPADRTGRLNLRGLCSGTVSRDGAEIPGGGPFPIPAGESRFDVVVHEASAPHETEAKPPTASDAASS